MSKVRFPISLLIRDSNLGSLRALGSGHFRITSLERVSVGKQMWVRVRIVPLRSDLLYSLGVNHPSLLEGIEV